MSVAPAKDLNLTPLYISMLFMGMGHSIVFAVMPMLGRELHLDELVVNIPALGWSWQPREMAITILSALSALTFFFASPWWGQRSDRVGRKRTMLQGMSGYFAGALLFCLLAWAGLSGMVAGFTLFGLMIAMRTAHVFIMAAVQPAATAYVVDTTTPGTRIKQMSRITAANQLGAMLGPALAWFTAISFLAPLILQASLVGFGALLLWRKLPDINPPREELAKHLALKFTDHRFRNFLLLNLLIFTLLGMVQQTMGFYFQDLLEIGRVEAAQRYSIAMICSALASLTIQLAIVQHLKSSPIKLIKAGLPLCLMGFVVLAMAEEATMLYVGMAIVGFGTGMAGPGVGVSATFQVESHEQGGLAGLLASFAGLGFVVGPLLGGFLYRFDMSYPTLFAAILMIPVIISSWRLRLD
ncbi:MAG: DHA1 family multidrug resistance protein-like MFS transporter [Halieaceae bacterium]|jgi:DHA1 family multidrug resistance protein-like MFS transporter